MSIFGKSPEQIEQVRKTAEKRAEQLRAMTDMQILMLYVVQNSAGCVAQDDVEDAINRRIPDLEPYDD